MAKKAFFLPPVFWMPAIILGLLLALNYLVFPAVGKQACPGSQIYCPGVGCVSGQDKCFAGSLGGASKVFSKETFGVWPGSGVRSTPPDYSAVKEPFTTCPDGTRTDGPCLLQV
jgi:hypothetical protein